MSRNQEIETAIETEADTDSGFAIAYAISKLADAVDSVAYQIERAGLANAVMNKDAVDYLTAKMEEADREATFRAVERNLMKEGGCP